MKRITLITFAVFMVEAIIHYNIGAKSVTKNASMDAPVTEPHHLGIPPTKDLLNMAIWVFIFAFITAKIIKD